MKHYAIRLIPLAAALMLAACASQTEFATPGEPHAIVTTIAAPSASSVYPVDFYRIGSHKIAGNARSYWLKPGTYEITVFVNLRQIAANEPVRLPNTRIARRETILHSVNVQVQSGRRYIIGARWIGPQVTDWKPVVVRVEGAS